MPNTFMFDDAIFDSVVFDTGEIAVPNATRFQPTGAVWLARDTLSNRIKEDDELKLKRERNKENMRRIRLLVNAWFAIQENAA